MEHSAIESIKELLEGFDFSDPGSEQSVPPKGITFWVPAEYKAKYMAIQEKSGRRFGRVLKEILLRSIDKVEIEG